MPTAAARQLVRTLGRRGVVLLIFGSGKVCYGAGFLADPEPRPRGLELLTSVAPMQCWAWVWIVFGSITFASAWLRIGRDRVGFLAALVPPSVWGVAYAVSAVDGYLRAWFIAGWFATSHAALICWAATVREDPTPRRSRKSPEGGGQ
ncbi:hypothetical protein [Streptomyces swartbergensis]|uniref:Uncharacterized protein n=1 Tax=Streptomyces swartbergensis TaxID=487165 RepID=A0A243S4V0_9ACTN|nr:hypothetical protein [Streptomyces swartbergensis]OUD02582.1 hypothetical protein CA983_14245 [Streptomyces swartbergensis]